MGIKLLVSLFPVQRGVRFLLYWRNSMDFTTVALDLLVLSLMRVHCSGLFGQGRQGRCGITGLWRDFSWKRSLEVAWSQDTPRSVVLLCTVKLYFSPRVETPQDLWAPSDLHWESFSPLHLIRISHTPTCVCCIVSVLFLCTSEKNLASSSLLAGPWVPQEP